MLRFNRPPSPPGFSLDKRDHVVRRRLQRREWRLLLTLPLAVLVIGGIIQYLTGYARLLSPGQLEPVISERALPAMPSPRLADAKPLPSESEIAAQRPLVRELMADNATVRHDEVLDALTVAWGEALAAGDAGRPPIPVTVGARDLLLGHLAEGSAVTIRGTILDAMEARRGDGTAAGWRLVLGIDEDQLAQVLLPATPAPPVVGRRVFAVGRYLGLAGLPTGTTGETAVPLLQARAINRQDEDQGDAEFRSSRPQAPNADLFAGVSDERSVMEIRPYYHLLGQARLDAGEEGPEPPSANLKADDLHRDPPAFRGQRFTVTGFVYRAWEDLEVARDRPFGIQRVVRLLLWSRDVGLVTEEVNGKKVFKSQILRLYEACCVSDAPLPTRGTKLAIPGRFFKFRAIPVDADRLRDQRNNVRRQSECVYPFVFTAAGWQEIPAHSIREWDWLDAVIGVAALMVIGVLIALYRRERIKESEVGPQIRRLRAGRRRLAEEPPAPTEPPQP